MDSNNFDDIEIIEVVQINKKCKAEVGVNKSKEILSNEKKKICQPTKSCYFANNLGDCSSSSYTVICDEMGDERKIHANLDNDQEKEEISGKAVKSVNGETTNAVASDSEPGTSNKETQESIKVIEKFISKWKEMKGILFGAEDKKIEQKLWKCFEQSNSSYKCSRKFIFAIEKGINNISEKTVYLFLKEIIDKLKHYRELLPKINTVMSCKNDQCAETSSDEVKNNKLDEKLRKLNALMKKISHKIQKLDEEEVDLTDEDNSAYLVQERLQKQLVRLNNNYCKLMNCSTNTGRPTEKKFKFKETRYPEINSRITAWINKYRTFPDYVDILELVKKVTECKKLPLKPESVRILARDIFTNVGKILKHRRTKDFMLSIDTYAKEDLPIDPAHGDPELDSKLMNNDAQARNNLDQVFQDFVDKEIEGGVVEESSSSSHDEGEEESNEEIRPLSEEEEEEVVGESHLSREAQHDSDNEEVCSDNAVSLECDDVSNDVDSSRPSVYSSHSASMDSFPDLRLAMPCAIEKEDPEIFNEPLKSALLPGVTITQKTDPVECNGVATNTSTGTSHPKIVTTVEKLFEENPPDEDWSSACSSDILIETVHIDTSPSDGEHATFKRKREISKFSPIQKKRCLSPEIVELD